MRNRTNDDFPVFLLLMLSGGFVGAYSYIFKGEVFANAQTANCLMLGIRLANGQTDRALILLVPILTYLIGCGLAYILQTKLDRESDGRWERMLLLIEIGMIAVLAAIPTDAPYVYSYVIIGLISSLQFETFRTSRGLAMSTLFCTAHIRETGANLFAGLFGGEKGRLSKACHHGVMILTFIAGAAVFVLISGPLGERAIILDAVPLLAAYLMLRLRKNSAGKPSPTRILP